MQAAELGEDLLASDLRARLRSRPDPVLTPIWTTRRTSRALSAELGRHDGSVNAVAVLPDGRVVSGGNDRRVLVWDPSQPGSGPIELGRHDIGSSVNALAVLPGGRVVSGGYDRRVLVWDAITQEQVAQLGCSVMGLTAVQASRGDASLVIIHEGQGFSLWSIPKASTPWATLLNRN
jgi:WD40 repeat protein